MNYARSQLHAYHNSGFVSDIIAVVGNRSTHPGSEKSAMTSKTTTLTKEAGKLECFPDYPPRDDMQNWLYLYDTSVITSLAIHFANEPNVTVASEVPVGPSLPVRNNVRIPDLLFVRGGNRKLMEEQRGYAIDRQGKAPDFVLEVASPTTGRVDYTEKRADYERFGVGEYWRFDPSGGEYHDAALAGDRLVDAEYEPIAIEMPGEGRLRGYSEALGLYVCWEEGMLRFFDPVAGNYLRSHDEDAGRARMAQAQASEERAGRVAERTRAEEERAGRVAAESRVAELEAELRRLRAE